MPSPNRMHSDIGKFRLATMIVMLVIALFYFPFPSKEATSSIPAPFTPHEVKVLVVSPHNVYQKGGHYLISDLARYGFDVTQHTSDNGTAVDYRFDPKTSDLSHYDVVILHGGYFGFPPTTVTIEEVNHFTSYAGILMVIGNALFGNESTRSFWENNFVSEPIQRLEQRLGVDFTDYLGQGGAWHNNGTFTLVNDSIEGLPLSLSYTTKHPIQGINYQVALTTTDAIRIYDFNTTSPLSGRVTSGVTYYKDSVTDAVGIYIQGSYIYATESLGPKISYFGLTDIEKRSGLIASLIAYALGVDINTIIKPQPLATIRLNDVGPHPVWDEEYLNASLFYFSSIIDSCNISPSIAFTDYHDVLFYYWETVAPNVLEQLKTIYREWEYSSYLQRRDPRSMSQSQIEALIENSRGNYSALGMDLFSTVVAPAGFWSQATLDAMANKSLYLIELAQGPYAPADWWNIRINSSVLVHTGMQMAGTANVENFTQISRDMLHYEYFRDRDKWSLAVLNGFPSFFYSVPNFRRNEVGPYSLKTVYANLTSEIPDIRFVPLAEAGVYFGNRLVSVKNPQRVGLDIEFDVNSSSVPDVVSLGKGMLWLRMDTNQTIREVLIDDKPWYYFDDYTIRIPADSRHVKVTLGDRTDPIVIRTAYKVTKTSWDDQRFSVSVSATPGLNVSIKSLIPLLDVFCSESLWNYTFDASSQVLDFWAISDTDGIIVLEAGADVTPPSIEHISHSSTWYNTSVTVFAHIIDSEGGVGNAVLGYSADSEWINVTMVRENGFYVVVIQAFPYGTAVRYRLYAFDVAGNSRVTEILSYNVTDEIPPEIGIPERGPLNPSAGQPVLVRVSVIEPDNASGLDSVMLWYFLDGDFFRSQSIEMKYENGFWWAEIPGQSEGKSVSFFIRATDKAGNVKTTEAYIYEVEVTGVQLPYLLVVGLALTSIGIGVGLYFIKFRKPKEKKD